MKRPAQPTASLTDHDFADLAADLGLAREDACYETIVNLPFSQRPMAMTWLFVGFICLYIASDRVVRLAAVSRSEHYERSVEHYKFNPTKFELYLKEDSHNTIVRAIATGKPQSTTDWVTLSRRSADPETVRLNQANSGIAYTVLWPLPGKTQGAVMYNFYQYPDAIGQDQQTFMMHYTQLASQCLDSHDNLPG